MCGWTSGRVAGVAACMHHNFLVDGNCHHLVSVQACATCIRTPGEPGCLRKSQCNLLFCVGGSGGEASSS